jgi:large subunit ribosomal protein L31
LNIKGPWITTSLRDDGVLHTILESLVTGPGKSEIILGFGGKCPGIGPGGYRRHKGKTMKDGIHPNYREVCFLDMSNNFKFVTRSCVNAKEMVKMDDGRELPLFKLDTSSESHPFYTGTQKSVDNMGGRVERFRNRFGKGTAAK